MTDKSNEAAVSGPLSQSSPPIAFIRRWGPFGLISLFFFLATATTFSSLGVVLPHMIEELEWSWSQAGAGFSVLALMVGLAAFVPAWIIRVRGVRASFLVGGGFMVAGFLMLAATTDLLLYFVGAGFAGIGYPLCATVPAVHYLNQTVAVAARARVIGAYLTIGGLGGVAGPIMVTTVMETVGDWRYHWWAAATLTFVLMLAVALFIRERSEEDAPQQSGLESKSGKSASKPDPDVAADWTFRQVIRTPQYYVIVGSMTLTLLCALTMNSWAVTHMVNLNVAAAVAAGALSGHALINSLARGMGGVLEKYIAAKWLLVSALAAECIGMGALAYADNPITITLFAIGEGYGYGMCFFATTILLVNYFGTSNNPEIFGSMHFVTTLAMIGPVLAGFVAERLGGFETVFVGYALLIAVLMFAAALMRPPQLQ